MVATSAARDASNSQEFLSAAEEATGVEPELLSGDEEGRLSFRGATADLPEEGSRVRTEELVVDIGGGSTELVVGVPGGNVTRSGLFRWTSGVCGSRSGSSTPTRRTERSSKRRLAVADQLTSAGGRHFKCEVVAGAS